MRRCPNCRRQIAEGNRTCEFCDEPLKQDVQEQSQRGQQRAGATEERTPRTGSGGSSGQSAPRNTSSGHGVQQGRAQDAEQRTGRGQSTRGQQSHQPNRQPPESGVQHPPGNGRNTPAGGSRPPQAGGAPRVGSQPRFSQGTLTGVSIVTAIVAILLLPPVFGGISIYAGYKVYTQYDESRGQLLMGAGLVATIAGLAVAAYVFTQM